MKLSPSVSSGAYASVRKLWQLWHEGAAAEVEAFLQEAVDLPSLPLLAVLRLDQHERWRHGDRRPVEDYLERFPALAADRERALDLVFSEFLLRQELGEDPDPDEYARRFPHLAEGLIRQLDLRQLFPSGSSLSEQKTLPTPSFEESKSSLPQAPPGYAILELLGEGGMGVVYKARQLALGRVVALKMLPPERHSAEEQTRLRSEAEAVARLHHPHIVQIFDLGECDGRPYFSMEWVEGGSLQAYLQRGPLSPRSAAALVEILARTMETVHTQGILHRDLKPANVLLAVDQGLKAEGRPQAARFDLQSAIPKIADFGLAKALGGAAGQTQSGAIMGTPSYMAPEQAEGKKDIGPPADIHALGALLYETLTGRPPFQAATPFETLRRVTSEEPIPPSRFQAGLPRDLETITLKCLAKQPAERYPSAAALADDLTLFLADRPIAARRASTMERLGRWSRRNPWLAGLSAALLLVLTTAAVSGLLLSLQLSRSLNQARTAEREGKAKLFASYLSDANASRMSGQLGQRFSTLERIEEALDLSRELGLSEEAKLSLRNIALAAFCLPDLGPEREWSVDGLGRAPKWVDPLHRRRARAAWMLKHLPPPSYLLRGPSWCSPDGRYLAAATQPYLDGQRMAVTARVWRVDAENPVPILDALEAVNEDATAFRPDSTQVAFGHGDGSVTCYELPTGQLLRRLAPGPGAAYYLAYHPTLPRLAVATGRDVTIWDLEKGARLVRLGAPGSVSSIAWHPGGHRLLTASASPYEICLWEAETGRMLTPPWKIHTSGGICVHFSQAGDRVCSSGWDGSQQFWDAATGRLLLSQARGVVVHFGSDDQTVAEESGTTVRRWAGGQEMRRLLRPTPQGPEQLLDAAIHRDGRLLAATTPGGLTFLDLHTGEEVGFLAGSFARGQLQFDTKGVLWVGGRAGLIRLPVRAVGRKQQLQVGPPEWVADQSQDGHEGFAVGANGQVVALPFSSSGTRLVHVTGPRRSLRLGPQYDVRHVLVSPDSRWVVTGSHFVDRSLVRYKVWDTASGRLLVGLPTDEVSGVHGFSRDGRWLFLSSDEKQMRLEVAALEPVEAAASQERKPLNAEPFLSPGVESPDGRLRAHVAKDGVVRLVLAEDPEKEVARLPTPADERLSPKAFSPDGATLLTTSPRGCLVVFDLARLRSQLAEIGLDWDDLQPRPEGRGNTLSARAKPLRLELLEPESAGSRERLGQAECRRAAARLAADPRDADAHFRLGKFLFEAGQGPQAYAHLSEALALAPDLEEALALRAEVAARLRRWDDAEADASRYLEQTPFANGVRILRARARQAQNRPADAIADYTLLLGIAPENAAFLLDRAECYEATDEKNLAAADRERARTLGSRGAIWLNDEAWRLVTGPVGTHDADRALERLQKILHVAPDHADYLNTLGVAQYRKGLYREALATLEKSLAAANGGTDGFDLYVLAMCHARLGDSRKARECFDRAETWVAAKKDLPAPWPDELKDFRAETVEVLGPR